jgi:hypothetical protein
VKSLDEKAGSRETILGTPFSQGVTKRNVTAAAHFQDAKEK